MEEYVSLRSNWGHENKQNLGEEAEVCGVQRARERWESLGQKVNVGP